MEVENLTRFQNLISVILKLQLYGAIQVQRREEDDKTQRFLIITAQRGPEVAALVDEFRRVLSLDPARNVFRITDRRMGRAVDEITIQTRSVLQIMSFLAKGVEISAGSVATGTIARRPGACRGHQRGQGRTLSRTLEQGTAQRCVRRR